MSIDQYNSLVETSYLLGTEANARHLLESLRDARGGHRLVYEVAADEVRVIACRYHYSELVGVAPPAREKAPQVRPGVKIDLFEATARITRAFVPATVWLTKLTTWTKITP